jgi:hypothetical protein
MAVLRANFALLVAVALVLVPSAVAQRQRDRSLFRTPVASFTHLADGWHQYRDGPDATALNWPYRPNSNGWAPSMPRGGAAVSVWFPHPRQKQRYRPLRLVLPRQPATFLEGTRDTPEFRIYGRVDGVDVNIFVDIRRLHPTVADLRSARRVVSSVRFR